MPGTGGRKSRTPPPPPPSRPGGFGSSGYWERGGDPGERKYHGQKWEHGPFDQYGYPVHLPPGGIAPFAQYESERIVNQTRARLFREAQLSRAQQLDVLGSYRPGGIAQLTSPAYENAARGLETFALQLEAPDLMYTHRRDIERRRRHQAEKAARIQAIGQLIGTVAGAAIPGFGALAGNAAGQALGQAIAPTPGGAAPAKPASSDAAKPAQKQPATQPAQAPAQAPPAQPGQAPAGQGPIQGPRQAPIQGPAQAPVQGPVVPGAGPGAGPGGGPGGGPMPGPSGGGGPAGPGGMPMGGGGSSATFDGAGQEHLPPSPAEALASPMDGIDGEMLMDMVLESDEDLYGERFNDAMFARLERIIAGDVPLLSGFDMETEWALEALPEGGF